MMVAFIDQRRKEHGVELVMEPLEFIERLAALVPAPRRHQVRYHGTLAPNSAWRRLIVPGVKEAPPSAPPSCGGLPTGERQRSRRIAWADLLRRVFAVDVLECPRCSGRMRIIATVTDPEAVRKVLACIGLPTRGPPLAPPREREQGEFGFGE